MQPPERPRLDRRTAIKWMLATGTTLLAGRRSLPAAFRSAAPAADLPPGATGYGTDPDLLRTYQPGDVWPLTFSDDQRRTAAALGALIIPADEHSPSAADLGVHDFIDEWISAPFPEHAPDRQRILGGLAWLEAEAETRFDSRFSDLDEERQRSICDAICHSRTAGPGLAEPAAFFQLFRDLTAGGFYSTPEGMVDIGYVGNRASVSFDGPPPEVLRKAGLA